MTGIRLRRSFARATQVVLGVLVVVLLSGAALTFAHNNSEGETLIVWAGDKAHEAPDFLAVVDFDRDSQHYGNILRIVPLPAGALGALVELPRREAAKRELQRLGCGGTAHVRDTIQPHACRCLPEFPYT